MTKISEKVFDGERAAVAPCCTEFPWGSTESNTWDGEQQIKLENFSRKTDVSVIVKLVNEFPSQEHIFQIFFCEKVLLDVLSLVGN